MKALFFSLLYLVHCCCSAINVTFVNPSVPGTAFWDRVTTIALAAAEDLSINLTVVYGFDNRIYNLEAIQKALSTEVKPDYVIFMPYDGNSENTYGSVERSKTHFVTVERTLLPREQELVGLPGMKYKYWLGEIFHDNVYAGKLLSDSLITQAKKVDPNKQLKVIGISGSFSGESNRRTTGLEQSISENSDATLLQVVPAIWSRERSRNIIHQLTSRFGKVDVAWTASDGMALGVYDSIQAGRSNINPDMFVGGIDWTVEAIEKVKSGDIAASVGGHIMQTAWALIKIYDHSKGINAFPKGYNKKTYDLEAITSDNIDQYYILSRKVDWSIVDFKQYSLYETKQKEYQLTFSAMLDELNQVNSP